MYALGARTFVVELFASIVSVSIPKIVTGRVCTIKSWFPVPRAQRRIKLATGYDSKIPVNVNMTMPPRHGQAKKLEQKTLLHFEMVTS